jgi:hypothetical protein
MVFKMVPLLAAGSLNSLNWLKKEILQDREPPDFLGFDEDISGWPQIPPRFVCPFESVWAILICVRQLGCHALFGTINLDI